MSHSCGLGSCAADFCVTFRGHSALIVVPPNSVRASRRIEDYVRASSNFLCDVISWDRLRLSLTVRSAVCSVEEIALRSVDEYRPIRTQPNT